MRRSYSTKVVYEMTETGLVLISKDTIFYSGPWEECKGDPTAKANEQLQYQFNQQLVSIFSQQYQNQTGILNYLKGKMQPIIDAGGQGYSPEALTALRTGASDQNAIAFQNADEALQNQISQASGGSKLTGVAGANIQAKAGLLNQKAIADSQAQNAITQANENLKQQNYWNAINVLNGTAAQINPLGYSSEVNSGGNTTANLSGAVTAANQSQLLGALGGIAGGIGSALGGGFSKGGIFNGCWVAASFWGWNGLKTYIVRLWMTRRAPAWFRNFYMKHGEWISSTPLRWAYRPIFEVVLAVQ